MKINDKDAHALLGAELQRAIERIDELERELLTNADALTKVMTTPTEDHWAHLSGADLVAELREMGESVLDPLTPVEARAAAAIMRAAEVIEAHDNGRAS